MGIAEQLISELEGDAEKRRRLARLLVPEVYSDQELRTATINALYRDIVTKEDLAELREELREDIRRLEERINRVEARIDSLVKWVIGMLATMWVTLVAALLASLLH